MKARTYTAGANAERDAIKAHVKRVAARIGNSITKDVLLALVAWLLQRDERYNKKSKGVGK